MATSYPRPDFQRKVLNWASLDGIWDFVFDDSDAGLSQQWFKNGIPDNEAKRDIKVPYAFQSQASGINLYEAHEVIWYERSITDIRSADERARGNRLLVRFGAVDYECSVWVGGSFVGSHRGGHVPFDVDVSDAFSESSGKETARLTVRVRDSPYDLAQPRGKQFWGPVPENIYYTPTSGIWLSVWMESVPKLRLCCSSGGTVLRADDIERGVLHGRIAVTGRPAQAPCSVEVEVSLGGVLVSTAKADLEQERDWVSVDVSMKVSKADKLRVNSPFNLDEVWHKSVALWAPEHPVLYDILLRLKDGSTGVVVDEIATTTGMRSLSWYTGDGTFRLNGKPYFQMLLLDQGYWPETGLTPPSSEALKADIEISKALGFNGCRKHQKVEDPRFHYWADRLGFLVWGEIANAYAFGPDYIERMNAEWAEAVKRDINHPCVVTWTPGNESWGYLSLQDNIDQRNHIRSLYYLTKTLDPSRPVNDNCGWEHVLTDLTTYHDYADSPELAARCSKMEDGILGGSAGHEMFTKPIYSGHTLVDPGSQHTAGAPVICTEFGGVNIAPAKDASSGERDWGYTTATDVEDFLKRFEGLVMAVVKGGTFLWAGVYAAEVNGLYSYDRKEKVPVARVKAIMDAAQDYYYHHTSETSGLKKVLKHAAGLVVK